MHIQTPAGELIDNAPYIYQTVDGHRIDVAGDFQLIDAIVGYDTSVIHETYKPELTRIQGEFGMEFEQGQTMLIFLISNPWQLRLTTD